MDHHRSEFILLRSEDAFYYNLNPLTDSLTMFFNLPNELNLTPQWRGGGRSFEGDDEGGKYFIRLLNCTMSFPHPRDWEEDWIATEDREALANPSTGSTISAPHVLLLESNLCASGRSNVPGHTEGRVLGSTPVVFADGLTNVMRTPAAQSHPFYAPVDPTYKDRFVTITIHHVGGGYTASKFFEQNALHYLQRDDDEEMSRVLRRVSRNIVKRHVDPDFSDVIDDDDDDAEMTETTVSDKSSAREGRDTPILSSLSPPRLTDNTEKSKTTDVVILPPPPTAKSPEIGESLFFEFILFLTSYLVRYQRSSGYREEE